MTSYRTLLFFAQAVGRVVRARRPGESATVFLPAVRPLLELAAEIETERNHVLPAPAPGEELGDPLLPKPTDERPGDSWQALGADAEFAHVLHGGRAVTAALDTAALAPEDEEFLGLPGLLSAEQTAAVLFRRDEDHRRRASSSRDHDAVAAEPGPVAPADLSWRAAGDLRRDPQSGRPARGAYRRETRHRARAGAHGRARPAVRGGSGRRAQCPARLAARADRRLRVELSARRP